MRAAALIASILFSFAFGSAQAADVPFRKAAPAPVYVPYNWNGWYFGGHLGYGWGEKSYSDPLIIFGAVGLSHDTDGFLGGFQTGYNFQSGNWLFGVEGQWSWSGIDGGGPGPLGLSFFNADVDWIATLTARVGVISDRWLSYLKGGAAWARDDYRAQVLATSLGAGETRSGWTVGLGVEYAWGNNWTTSLEYNFLDFGERTLNFGAVPVGIEQEIHVIKVGLNYKLDWGKAPTPIATRY